MLQNAHKLIFPYNFTAFVKNNVKLKKQDQFLLLAYELVIFIH